MSDHILPDIIRTERGLTITGMRITLYDILQYLHDSRWTEESTRDILHLTSEQMRAALAYISAHRAEVEAESRDVVAQTDEIRRYWEERNRARYERIAATPPTPEKAALRAKLARQRTLRARRQPGEPAELTQP